MGRAIFEIFQNRLKPFCNSTELWKSKVTPFVSPLSVSVYLLAQAFPLFCKMCPSDRLIRHHLSLHSPFQLFWFNYSTAAERSPNIIYRFSGDVSHKGGFNFFLFPYFWRVKNCNFPKPCHIFEKPGSNPSLQPIYDTHGNQARAFGCKELSG